MKDNASAALLQAETAAEKKMNKFFIASIHALLATLRYCERFGTDVYITSNGRANMFDYESPLVLIQFNGGVFDQDGEEHTFVWDCIIPQEFYKYPETLFEVTLRVNYFNISVTGNAVFENKAGFEFYHKS